ncbi:hypothetical protein ACY2LX_003502 [Acinetobacter baumannii]|uniref:Uncharacterized protein n=1 Tax=Acinetobacter baumannii TaxID=470 RepID=A0AAD2U6G0_ACIBA|nr:hypothetical protein [Acinetobacter baumannii]EHZ7476394.1 hypothetical protein [Acinetobacter baumannii]EJD6060259.1 hypothetical protein [Acinetobacter baumannii]EKU0429657.1 hypothetical protein [Acinetobacter baumannii]EKU0961685.1 hypothetical protein [Acinetobacter baumannii]EKU2090358.1 hypothetical protein [Acinetobacter baumannii]
MDNYKIKVKDEARADEAKELFKKLGYHHDNSSYKPYVEWIAVFEDCSGSFYSHNVNLNECVEITIAQLRDLVVLKRNNVKDANYKSANDFYYVTVENQYYFWNGFAWCLSDADFIIGLSPIIDNPENKDPALISGADALADITNVQHAYDDRDVWYTTQYSTLTIPEILKGETSDGRKINFRLKPQTIKVELDLPKPFEPKVGDIYWFLSPFYSTGYDHCTFANDSSDKLHVQYGAYRSEDDVKKAVEQLRKIRGAS